MLIERTLVLIRNVLQIPTSPDERRADNDASLHDQVLWSLHQSGVFDLILYIISSEYEHQYHLHALEIICLIYREQVRITQFKFEEVFTNDSECSKMSTTLMYSLRLRSEKEIHSKLRVCLCLCLWL